MMPMVRRRGITLSLGPQDRQNRGTKHPRCASPPPLRPRPAEVTLRCRDKAPAHACAFAQSLRGFGRGRMARRRHGAMPDSEVFLYQQPTAIFPTRTRVWSLVGGQAGS